MALLIAATVNSNPYNDKPVKVSEVHPYRTQQSKSDQGIDKSLKGVLKNRTHQKWEGEL